MGPSYRRVLTAATPILHHSERMSPHVNVPPSSVLVLGDRLTAGHAAKAGDDTGLSLTVADIEETHQSQLDEGVTFMKPITEATPLGTRATWLADPDGTAFFIEGNNMERSTQRFPTPEPGVVPA